MIDKIKDTISRISPMALATIIVFSIIILIWVVIATCGIRAITITILVIGLVALLFQVIKFVEAVIEHNRYVKKDFKEQRRRR